MENSSFPRPLLLFAGAYLKSVRFLAGVSMAIIVCVMIAQVFARYVLGSSLIWAEELCRYLLIWQTFLVLGLAYSHGEFVQLDFLSSALSKRNNWFVRAIIAVPILVFLALMAWMGADYASRFDRQTIPAVDFIWESLFGRPLGMSIGYVYISVSVGMVMLALHVVADLIVTFRPDVLVSEKTPEDTNSSIELSDDGQN